MGLTLKRLYAYKFKVIYSPFVNSFLEWIKTYSVSRWFYVIDHFRVAVNLITKARLSAKFYYEN